MRSVTTLLLGLGFLLLTSCNEKQATVDQQATAPNTVSQQQPDDSQQHDHGQQHAQQHAQQHGHEHGHGPQHGEQHAQQHNHRPVGDHGHQSQHAAHQRPATARQGVTKISIGDKVPDFEVTINDKKWTFSQLQKNAKLTGDGTMVLTFWCSFCHSCRHIEQNLNKLAQQYQGKAAVIALDSSDGETTEEVAQFAKEKGLTLPIALNASGNAADIFGARVTTTTVVIDKHGVLRYCGQFGDARHPYTRQALEAVLLGKTVRVAETKHRG